MDAPFGFFGFNGPKDTETAPLGLMLSEPRQVESVDDARSRFDEWQPSQSRNGAVERSIE